MRGVELPGPEGNVGLHAVHAGGTDGRVRVVTHKAIGDLAGVEEKRYKRCVGIQFRPLEQRRESP